MYIPSRTYENGTIGLLEPTHLKVNIAKKLSSYPWFSYGDSLLGS